MFASRELKRADLKFSKSRTPNASFICKTRVSRPKYRVHHTRVWRTWDLDFEINELMFYQVMWTACLQSRGAWISGKRFQKDQETESLHGWGWQNFRETEPYHGKSQFLPEEEFSRSWTSFVKTRLWKQLKLCFLILKSLNSDNLWKRLKESSKVLNSFCSPEHMPLRKALEGE